MSDVVIVGAKRTAIGSMLGQFTGVPTPTLGATAIKAALDQGGVAPGDVCLSPPPPPTGPVPVPYVNMLSASDLTKGSKSVKIVQAFFDFIVG